MKKKDDAKKEEKTFPEERMAALRKMLEALVEMNIEFLRRHQKLTGENYPSLYDVTPKYRGPTDLGIWRDIPSIAKAGVGDACDLVCWRIAELRKAGFEDVYPFIKMSRMNGGGFLTTVQVRIHDMLEDPTAILAGA